MEEKIYVYFDDDVSRKQLIGYLYFAFVNGNEIYSFEFSNDFLKSDFNKLFLDVNLYPYSSRQYLPKNKKIFDFLSDLAPDRWGRTLIKKREVIRAKEEGRRTKTLNEIDFLLQVDDESRMGAIRLSLDGINYLSNEKNMEVPPFEYIRKLESASLEYENDRDALTDKWIKQLIGPGSSLGGARPKATVKDTNGDLWIAKFPSKNDTYDEGAWEKTAHDLAKLCGLKTCEVKLVKYSNLGSTFLMKRFDRNNNKRIHFISAMTAIGANDGDGSQTNMGYLDILSFIKGHCKKSKENALELYKRIVFNMCISNIDDHFRNHAFIYADNGLELSPIYDINPNPESQFLSLNITKNSSYICIDNLLETAHYYDLTKKEALSIINSIRKTIRENYKNCASKNGLSENNISYMKDAFTFAEGEDINE